MLREAAFVPGEYYHIYNRGIDKRIIFKSTYDYRRFIMLLYVANSEKPIRLDDLINTLHKKYEEILNLPKSNPLVSIGAWCLMPNHFHIIIREEIENGVTKFMRKLGVGYSMYFNIKYQRTGSLFGGVFKSKNISDDRYLKHLFGYISLNPLDLEFPEWEELIDKQNPKVWTDFLKKYQYSSYFDYIGVNRVEKNILNKEAFPEYFSSTEEFEDFVESYLSFNSTL